MALVQLDTLHKINVIEDIFFSFIAVKCFQGPLGNVFLAIIGYCALGFALVWQLRLALIWLTLQ